MGNEQELTKSGDVTEFNAAGAVSKAQHEIEASLTVAKRFRRNETDCFQRLMISCTRLGFSEAARYKFPRAGKDIIGPSINLAREAARIWGNIEWGVHILRDDDEGILMQGVAWDKEANVRVVHEDSFKKLIQRKDKNSGETVWIIPDERDLRELLNRRAALLVRNCLLQLMPKDLVEYAMDRCLATIEEGAAKDPDATQKRLAFDFGTLNITIEMLEKKLGHAFLQCSPKELAELRTVCTSIKEGQTNWAEYARETEPEVPAKDSNKEALKAGLDKMQQTRMEQDKPADPPKQKEALTMAMARAALLDTTSSAEVGAIVMWSFEAKLTPEERAEIQKLKDEACSRMAKAAQESKRKR